MDSDAAIEEFHRPSDKERQYMTRTMVEYMDGNFEEALQWLGRACKIENPAPEQLLDELKKDKNGAMFGIMYYTGLMTAALLKGNEIGEAMFDAWNKLAPEEIIPDSREYPVNIILWRIGTCKALKQPGSAEYYYKEAISSTDSQLNNLPHYMARLAMKAEYAGLLEQKNFKKAFKSFDKDYCKWRECAPASMESLKAAIDSLIDQIGKEKDDSEKQKLTLKIVHMIPVL